MNRDDCSHGGGHGHHGHGDHGGHHGHPGHGHGGHDRPRGPGGGDTNFLDLEISKVIHEEARSVTREAARDLLREAVRERLRERLGTEIKAVGALAADEMVDDYLANRDIEDRIEARKAARRELDARLRAILGPR